MGPAPMIRMLWMSVRLGTASASARLLTAQVLLGDLQLRLEPPQHQVIEALEEPTQIVRTGARLRMALETENRPLREGEALQRTVEQRAVRRHDSLGQRALIDREAVVLTGDKHAPGLELLHRMVRAVMAELHLHGACTGGEPENLVSKTDAEHRQVRLEKALRGLDRVGARLGISRTVGEEDSVGLQSERVLGGGLRRHYGHAAAAIGEESQDVALDTEVVRHYVQALIGADRRARGFGPERALVPLIAALGAHDLREVHALEARELARDLHGGALVGLIAGHDAARLRTLLPEDACQPARIDT